MGTMLAAAVAAVGLAGSALAQAPDHARTRYQSDQRRAWARWILYGVMNQHILVRLDRPDMLIVRGRNQRLPGHSLPRA